MKCKKFPLTSIQKGVWVHQMSYPDVPFYNIGGYLRIDGKVDPVIFEKAKRKIVRENDALRIVLRKGDLLPTQEFLEDADFDFPFVDFSEEDDPMGKAVDWIEREVSRPFDLYDRFLFRYALVKVSEDCYCYLSCHHHLITDGLSSRWVCLYMADAYNELMSGKDNLSPKPTYAEIVLSDKKFIQSKRFEQCKNFWKDKYPDIPEPMVPRNHNNLPGVSTLKSGFSYVWIKREKFNELVAFSREHKATPFHLLTAALYIYFLRTAGGKNFVFGMSVSNRTTASAKATVGLFTSVCPVRLDFGLDIKSGELLESIAKELRRYYRYQKFPISEINKQCEIYKEGGRQLFDLTISYEKIDYNFHFNGSPVECVTLPNGYGQIPLAIALKDYHENQDVRLDFSYNLGFFNKTEIKYIEDRIEFIMEEMVRHPNLPVKELQIMPGKERKKVLFSWNKTKRDFPSDICIHNLFENQVRLNPDAVAVIIGDKRISYSDLNTRADRLASRLQKLGLSTGELVGIKTGPSVHTIAGILGIMKAGGAYLPLDPSYPEERIAYMIKDSGINKVLVQEKTTKENFGREVNIICIEEGKGEGEGGNRRICSDRYNPENLAYVIYTSGTTGRPKGVMITHRSLCNLAIAIIKIMRVQPGSVVLQYASFSFDSSVVEIFMALCSGSALCLATREEMLPGPPLIKTLKNFFITHVILPPSSLSVMPHELLPSLKTIIVAGEVCPLELAQKWSKNRCFINGYGPTESTVCATAAEYYKGMDNLHIGKPIDNTSVFICDKYLNPVPIGAAGEIFIGGVGLSKGYINKPDLTKEKFIANPFKEIPLAHLYRTGDFARWLPDGNIEFLGRMDNQVKIRGYRVELQEIEATLVKHPGVKEAAVIMKGEGLQDKQLVAYFLETEGGSKQIESSELKIFLKKVLPKYMVPTFICRIKEFSLTPNGKIDRNAFPDPDIASQSKPDRQKPETNTEKILLIIWETVIGREEIGREDDFFEAGMDSLQTIQFISNIEEKFKIQILPTELFEKGTIKELGEYIDRENKGRKDSLRTVVKIQDKGPRPPFFCVTVGYGDMVAFKGLSDHLGLERPFFALQPTDTEAVSIRDLAETYISKTREIQPKGPYNLGGYSVGGILAFEMARQLRSDGEEINSLIMLGAPTNYNLLGHKIHSFLMKIIPKLFPKAHETRYDIVRIIRSLFSDQGLRIHLQCVLGYEPEPYQGEITLLEGRWASTRLLPWKKKWSNAAKGGLKIHLMPGNHDSFIRPPYVRDLAKYLKSCLENSDKP